jgi:AGZA family xanthine/uracil permease-like MFS transporter
MPVFFSIYWGFALGFISYVLIKSLSGKRKEINPMVWGLAAIFALHLFF